jgi:multisubunit Na+/H+ antiporter MnhB subunit
MSSGVVCLFILGLLASSIGIYVIKTKHWVDISKYSLEIIESEGSNATCVGVIFLSLGIILLLLCFISWFMLR